MTPIIGSGKQRIQPIWADDVGAYFAKAVDLDAATGRTFELGGPDAVTLERVLGAAEAASAASRRPSLHMPIGAHAA